MTNTFQISTYATIDDAFKFGTGDQFYTKNGQFVAVSRKDDYSQLIENGFESVDFQLIIDMIMFKNKHKGLLEQMAPKQGIEKLYETTPCRENFYDEFPDAYNNHL